MCLSAHIDDTRATNALIVYTARIHDKETTTTHKNDTANTTRRIQPDDTRGRHTNTRTREIHSHDADFHDAPVRTHDTQTTRTQETRTDKTRESGHTTYTRTIVYWGWVGSQAFEGFKHGFDPLAWSTNSLSIQRIGPMFFSDAIFAFLMYALVLCTLLLALVQRPEFCHRPRSL